MTAIIEIPKGIKAIARRIVADEGKYFHGGAGGN